jgi:hypothetical protein
MPLKGEESVRSRLPCAFYLIACGASAQSGRAPYPRAKFSIGANRERFGDWRIAR